ncbi:MULTISPECIES: ATP-dependent sacrificial sulfur transferase LarE [unclassified Thermotoga]|uniref:ATP-dependent sacrificial sulfur transferase LarE n=1 Tax=unclassified Thermotoga TaxID=2631113 RepID=UPI000280EB0E|nr:MULTISPECIES: ATP-dependent sacrificial sulfur transferase LarE [unclassified Thermotoga]AIY87339.1 PP-loop domain protein [Thermotoga sp. 2812B]EJX26393.1 PP-loop domain protein [Thermotoga sp. EMP]
MDKLQRISEAIKSKKKLVVMFSGGVDSTLLAKLAREVLGKNAVALTIDSPVIPRKEIEEAKNLANLIGIRHEFIELNELKSRHLIENPPDRCYLCRKLRDNIVKNWARENGFDVIADGLNFSDLQDYRPGVKASTEDGIWHPFIDFEVTKEEIREYSRKLGLPTWDKPAMACLCSRFPYGFGLNEERVRMVEKAENFLRELGFREVRVRFFPYKTAVVEVGRDEMELLMGKRTDIVLALQKIGFSFVTLDLEGFASGKLNRTIEGMSK